MEDRGKEDGKRSHRKGVMMNMRNGRRRGDGEGGGLGNVEDEREG